MNKIKAMDAKILAQFQRFCDWLTKMFGIVDSPSKMSFTALTVIVLVIPMSSVLKSIIFDEVLSLSKLITFLVLIFFSIFYGVILFKIYTNEKKKNEVLFCSSEPSMKPSKLYFFYRRDSFATFIAIISGYAFLSVIINIFSIEIAEMGLFVFGILHYAIFAFFQLVFYYFINCTPLPPTKSKLRQWLDSLKMKFSPAKVTSSK